MTIKKDGTVAVADDFENVTIELTPIEWQELVALFEYRVLLKNLKKLKSVKPCLK